MEESRKEEKQNNRSSKEVQGSLTNREKDAVNAKTEEKGAGAKGTAGEQKGEAAPQKKRITAVFRPQNSAGGARRSGGGSRAGAAGGNGGSSPRRSSSEGGRRSGENRPRRNASTVPVKEPVRRPITAKSPDQIRDRASAHNAEKIDQMLAESMRKAAEDKALAAKAAEEAARKAAEEAKAAEAKAAEEAKAAKAARAEETKVSAPEALKPAASVQPVSKESRPRTDRHTGTRTQSDRPFTRSQGDRPAGARSQSDRPFTRSQGDRPSGMRSGDRPGTRTQGDRPYSPRSQGDRPYGARPQSSDRPYGQRRPSDGRPASGYGRSGGYGRDFAGGKDKDERENRPGQNRRAGGAKPAAVSDGLQKPGSMRKTKPAPKQNDRYGKRYEEEENLRALNKSKKGAFHMPQPKKVEEEEIKTIILPEVLTIKELADKMKKQPSAIIKKLFMQGKIVNLNQEIDYATAEEIAMDYEILCEPEVKVNVLEELLKDTEDAEDTLTTRPPVVCVMGHVDHGKTSLLDTIRESNVTAKEAGGITQHIGAYTVEINGQAITFLDTPGHEAFTAMRMRGAQSTDIAILVVAADDGVMPQTIEAINHAKAAEVEIIVAVNKIDKPNANVERVKQELTEYGLIAEDWGGSTIFCPVSAHTKEGIENLLEMILLTAEVKELRANPNRNARGLIIEAELDRGKGPVATVLVQKGTLRVGDAIAAGSCFGRVRAMMDDKGRRVKEAGPSMPVEILGFSDVPGAGEICIAMESEKEARNFAETFISEGREKLLEDTKGKMSLDDLFSKIQEGKLKELNIIVKADVQGSVEAVKQSLLKLSNEEVVVKIIHGGVGAITESDVNLASASNAIIIGFNVRPDNTAKSIAESEQVDVRLYRVIYQAIEDVEAAMKGMLDPVFEERVIGHGLVRQTFKASGVGTIAGVYVTDGKFVRNCGARITRDGEQIFEGAVASLKRFKDDVKEVAKGYECGLVFEGFNDLQEDDVVEAYTMVEVPR
ncbi:MAG: translation initiation factor IF-2 [Lachnospiraceae bacterium]|nr:translation initiation factor IF-2 [Lachnospiraceae bacterium]